jgi:glycosyltransferase involved in cell wall biosynthesis
MLFSVVTPSFNQGRFLSDCLKGVADQRSSDVHVEHIVVDACSTDETRAVLESSTDVSWTSEPDEGQTDAINKGFRRASGDWLMWLNADDFLLPQALARVRNFVAHHPRAEVIYGDCQFVDEAGRKLRNKREGRFNLMMLILYGCYIPSTATFFRRSIVERGLFLDPLYRNCMDLEYFVRLASTGVRFEHLPEILAAFRFHDSNVSFTFAQRRKQEKLEIQRKFLTERGLGWLGRPIFLDPLMRLYQIKRAIRRTLGFTP